MRRLMGLQKEREPMKVVIMTKVTTTNETAEQIRSVSDIANNCA